MPVQALRPAVARHVELRSLREVAREIGMSPSGLHSFLRSEGRRAPHARTYGKLVTWFVRTRSQDSSGATAADAEAGVAILVRYLPPAKRSEAVREILNVLSSHAGESVPPEWLRQMRARYSKRRGKQR